MTFKTKGRESHTKTAGRREKLWKPRAGDTATVRASVAEERPTRETEKGRQEREGMRRV